MSEGYPLTIVKNEVDSTQVIISCLSTPSNSRASSITRIESHRSESKDLVKSLVRRNVPELLSVRELMGEVDVIRDSTALDKREMVFCD